MISKPIQLSFNLNYIFMSKRYITKAIIQAIQMEVKTFAWKENTDNLSQSNFGLNYLVKYFYFTLHV